MYKTILLQKSKISDAVRLLFLTACLYFAAGNTQSGWLYYIIAIILGILLMNLLLSVFKLRAKIAAIRTPSEPIKVGESFTVDFEITNAAGFTTFHNCLEFHVNEAFAVLGPFPRQGSQEEMLIKDFNGSTEAFLQPDSQKKTVKFYLPRLAPQERVRFSCTLKALRRGSFVPGILKSPSNYPFSLITAVRTVFDEEDFKGRIRVYPAPVKIRKKHNRQTINSERRALALKSSEGTLRGLHEYSEGEDVRHIHWLTSARLNKIIVKEFQQNKETERLLLIPVADGTTLKELRPRALSEAEDLRKRLDEPPKPLSPGERRKILGKLKKAEKELNAYFGFEELLCCLMTAAEGCTERKGSFRAVFYNNDGRLRYINSLKRLRNEISGWSLLDNPFYLKTEEQKNAFYHLIEKALPKGRFSRIIVLSLSQAALPLPLSAAGRKAAEYLLFSPVGPSEKNSGVYASFSKKVSALRALSRSAELIDPTTSPEKAAKKL